MPFGKGRLMIRTPVVANMFYPGDPQELSEEVDSYLKSGKAELPQNFVKRPAFMAMLPHAGHIYCGKVIGKTLQSISLPSRLIILCPSHTGRGKYLAIWEAGEWQTPLGSVPIDTECTTALLHTPHQSSIWFSSDYEAHLREHSIEVLLPFLLTVVPKLKITPICVSCPPQLLESLGTALADILQKFAKKGEEIGVIISSDMNHYANEETTLKVDALALAPFLNLDPVKLFHTVVSHRISMCGIFPATMALFACKKMGIKGPAILARHSTSAESSRDTSHVVGYAGVYILRE